MFTVTPAAVEQISAAADGSNPLLRVAAKIDTDGELVYGMGFDDERNDDLVIECGSVSVLIAPASQPFLDRAVLDFVEVHPGEFQFVFSQIGAPGGGGSGGGCGSGGCGSGGCGGGTTGGCA